MKYRGLHTPPTMWRGPTPPKNPRPGDVWLQTLPDEIILTYTIDGWRR